MGPRNSKEDSAQKELTVTDSSTKMVENSSGFHMIEIHMPSMGMGLLIVGVGVLVFLAYRWRNKNRRRQRELRPHFPLMPAASAPWTTSFPYGYRYSPYPPGRIDELPVHEERRAPQGLPQPDDDREVPVGPAMARM